MTRKLSALSAGCPLSLEITNFYYVFSLPKFHGAAVNINCTWMNKSFVYQSGWCVHANEQRISFQFSLTLHLFSRVIFRYFSLWSLTANLWQIIDRNWRTLFSKELICASFFKIFEWAETELTLYDSHYLAFITSPGWQVMIVVEHWVEW
jgi:hypothetical protein